MADDKRTASDDALESDPSSELGFRNPLRDKRKAGDAKYNPTPPRDAIRTPEAPTMGGTCTQCSAPLDRTRAVRSDAKEYDYYFCDVSCHDRWQRDKASRSSTDRHE